MDTNPSKKFDEPTPQELVLELKDLLYEGGNFPTFFPQELEQKIRDNFKLFDRDNDDHLDAKEVKILLTSVDVDLEDHDIEMLFKELSEENKGISVENFFLFIMKKKRDENKEAQLLKCFQTIDKEKTGVIKDADEFKDLLMTKGLRMQEDEANQILEVLNPKGKETFEYKDFCKLIGAKEEKKKKKKKKGKKKKK